METLLENIEVVLLDYYPAYAPQRNGLPQHFVQDMSLQTRVMITGTGLPDDLWAEEIHHDYWLRSLLPPASVGKISPKTLRSNTNNDFAKIHIFGQPVFAFIYRPETKETIFPLHVSFMLAFYYWKLTNAIAERTIQSQNEWSLCVSMNFVRADQRSYLPWITSLTVFHVKGMK